ncbi:MAG: GNAT family N-acetyltransferase [Acidobacteria bacterium]|nr:GNAT family N-acetyltransferase [Acidobacteriota bacterium]
MSLWQPLPWDSEQFGFPAARLELPAAEARERYEKLVEAALAECRQAGIRHIVARVGAGELAAIHALEAAGFETLDGIQTLALELADWTPAAAPDGIEVRLFRPADLGSVLAIARTSYVCDRFHADSALGPGVADALHAAWVRNCCSGQAADAVVVGAQDGEALGFVTCKLEGRRGRIILVATASRARGRGIARAMTEGALRWFQSQGAEGVEVGTQLRNVAAARLYESRGFRLTAVSLTLRKVL